jgi:hypothetical protein
VTKQKFNVNNLRVASPCQTNWENMRGNAQVRFCDLCSLNVYNISEMTETEVQSLILSSEGRICGKIYKRTDGTVITRDCPVGLRAYYKRTARFAGTALTAILGLFSISFGQSNSKKDTETVPASKVKIVRTTNQNQDSVLSGTIFDPNGAVIPNVEVILSKGNKKDFRKVRSDDNGEYSFSSLEPGIYQLKANTSWFKKLEVISLEIKSQEKSQLNITLELASTSVTMGIVVEEPMIDTTSSSVTTKITRQMIERLPH